jgi:hypothetical protein
MASHNIVGNARHSSTEEERSQDSPVAFLSAGHRFCSASRSLGADRYILRGANGTVCNDGTMRLGHREERSESIQVKRLTSIRDIESVATIFPFESIPDRYP